MQCLHPRTIKNPKKVLTPLDYHSIIVPCGKCPACLRRRQNSWAFRILNEAKDFEDRSYFVTLTYNDESLSFSPSGIATLSKTDITKFFHDFRQYLDRNELGKIRYFLCGEYGDKFSRPHYHMCLFTEKHFTYQALQSIIHKCWNKCNLESVNIGSLTPQSAQYCAKYSLKRFGIDYADCTPPFALASKRPYIGYKYLSEEKSKYLRKRKQFHDFIGNTPYSLPRIYQEKVFTSKQKYVHQNEVQNLLERQTQSIIDQVYNGDRITYYLTHQLAIDALEKHLLKSIKL